MKRIKAAVAAGVLLAGGGLAALGLASPAGADVTGYEKVTQSGTVAGGTSTTEVIAYCPTGKVVLGGGWDVNQTQFLALTTRVVTNKPTGSNNGWMVVFTQTDGPGDKSLGVVVIALCATPGS